MNGISNQIVNTVSKHVTGTEIKKGESETSPLMRACLKPLTLLQVKEGTLENKDTIKSINICVLTVATTTAVGVCVAFPPVGLLTVGAIGLTALQLHLKDNKLNTDSSKYTLTLNDGTQVSAYVSNIEKAEFTFKADKDLKEEIQACKDKIKKNQIARNEAVNKLSRFIDSDTLRNFTVPAHARPLVVKAKLSASQTQQIEIEIAYKIFKNTTNTIETKKVKKEKLIQEIPKRYVSQHYKEFANALMSEIPDLHINQILSSSNFAQCLDLNNNGLKLSDSDIIVETDGITTIDRDEKKVELRCVTRALIEGTLYDLRSSREKMAYLEKDRLYSGKYDARYHDIVNVSKNIITLCDGSGHNKHARPAAVTACNSGHNYSENHLNRCDSTRKVLQILLGALKRSSDVLDQNEGQTTYIQTAVLGNFVIGVSVGDSGAYVFRQKKEGGWHAINLLGNTKGTLDSSVSGGQLGKGSDLHKTHVFSFQLEVGDVVYVCSDGIIDNLDPSSNNISPRSIQGSKLTTSIWESTSNEHINLALCQSNRRLEEIIKDCKSGEDIPYAIHHFVEENTKAKKINFMTNPISSEKDCPGKLDDAAVGYYVYSLNLNEII